MAAESADVNDKGWWLTWSAITFDDIQIFQHLLESYILLILSSSACFMGPTCKLKDLKAMEEDEDNGNNEETAEEGREQTSGEAAEDSSHREGWKAKGRVGKEGAKEQNNVNSS